MSFREKSLLEKLALIVSVLAGFLFILFGLNQILSFLGPLFIGKSFFLSNSLVAGVLDLLIALLIFIIEFNILKIKFFQNYLYRGLTYFVFAFLLSMCATIALGGLLYIFVYFAKK